MKKAIFIIILITILSSTLFAMDPFAQKGLWEFTLEDGSTFTLYFRGDSWAEDITTKEKYGYGWYLMDKLLKLYKFPLHGGEPQKVQIIVDTFLSTATDYREGFEGHIVGTDEIITGWHVEWDMR